MTSLTSAAVSSQAGLGGLPVEIFLQITSYLTPPSQESGVGEEVLRPRRRRASNPFADLRMNGFRHRSTTEIEIAHKEAIRDSIRDLKNLAISCKSFYEVLRPVLYRRSGEEDDWYALRWGCFHGSIPTLEAALAFGAPLDHGFADNIDEYHWKERCACLRLNADICVLFHEKQPVRSAHTPLLTAIRGGQVEAVDWLLAKGADPNWARPSVPVPSIFPRGNLTCDTCARPFGSCEGGCGITPLQGALDYFSHYSFGGSLLKRDTDRVKVLGSLLSKGADFNQRFVNIQCPHRDLHLQELSDNAGSMHWNPLGLALFTQTVGPLTVKFLLENGARFAMGKQSLLKPVLAHMSACRVEECAWRYPIDLPLYECEQKARVLMSTHVRHEDCSCIPSYDSLNSAMVGVSMSSELPYRGHSLEKVFGFLHEYGLPILRSKIDPASSKQVPPLIKAVTAQSPQAVKLLLEAGADPNARSAKSVGIIFPGQQRPSHIGGFTVLSCACMCPPGQNLYDMLLQLLKGGADPNRKNSNGSSPLHVVSQETVDPTTFRILLEHGADLHARDREGWTPLQYGCWNSN